MVYQGDSRLEYEKSSEFFLPRGKCIFSMQLMVKWDTLNPPVDSLS